MTEVWAVGRASGVALADDLVDRQHRLVLSQADDPDASLQNDLLGGHRMEIDALQGATIRLGPRARRPDAADDRGLRDPRAVGDPQRASGSAANVIEPGRAHSPSEPVRVSVAGALAAASRSPYR